MGWIGKIIGGTVGFMFGGPLGMIAGAVFGNVFDHAPRQGSNARASFGQQSNSGSPFTSGNAANSQQQAQMVFFVGAFSMLAGIASADGDISIAERMKVEEFIRKDLRLDPQSSAIAMKVFETAGSSSGSFDQFAAQFYDNFKHNRQMMELMIDIFYRVSYADGRLSTAEESLIDQAGRTFQVNRERMSTIKQQYGTGKAAGSTRSFAVLGLEPSASNDEIKRSYRKLVSEYHPDKISSKGLPEEFIVFASDKFREIQAAYEELRVSRNL
jgi:DnaJ like chaperone protein